MKNMLADKEHFLYKLKRISSLCEILFFISKARRTQLRREITFHKGEIVPYYFLVYQKKYLFLCINSIYILSDYL